MIINAAKSRYRLNKSTSVRSGNCSVGIDGVAKQVVSFNQTTLTSVDRASWCPLGDPITFHGVLLRCSVGPLAEKDLKLLLQDLRSFQFCPCPRRQKV